ncbi:MAG: CoA transferase, partial [Thermoplasmatales archaeon]
DISMLDCTMSLLSLQVPLVSLGIDIPKTGNFHPNFTPVGVYKCKDGYVSISVGNEAQWRSMVELPIFKNLDRQEYSNNNDRNVHAEKLTDDINSILKNKHKSEIIQMFKKAKIPISEVCTIKDVLNDSYLSSKLLHIKDPNTGLEVTLAPPPIKLASKPNLCFPPRFGEHNKEIYSTIGYDEVDLKKEGII